MYALDPLKPLTTTSVAGFSDVITELNWYYQDTVDGVTYKIYGAPIKLSAPEEATFIEFNSLTEETLTDWIESLLSPSEKEWYIGRIEAHQSTKENIYARWVANRDAWDSEQQELLANEEIEQVTAFRTPEPTWGDSICISCAAPTSEEKAFPWA